jgi:CrcB protein
MKSFYPFLLVFLGGGLGAMVRYAAEWIPFGSAFPYSTLLVNVLGSLLLGLLFAFTKPGFMGPMLTLFLGVGIMGGFTTFSGFSLHSIKLVEQAQYGVFAANVLCNNILSIAACWLGVSAGRWLS